MTKGMESPNTDLPTTLGTGTFGPPCPKCWSLIWPHVCIVTTPGLSPLGGGPNPWKDRAR